MDRVEHDTNRSYIAKRVAESCIPLSIDWMEKFKVAVAEMSSDQFTELTLINQNWRCPERQDGWVSLPILMKEEIRPGRRGEQAAPSMLNLGTMKAFDIITTEEINDGGCYEFAMIKSLNKGAFKVVNMRSITDGLVQTLRYHNGYLKFVACSNEAIVRLDPFHNMMDDDDYDPEDFEGLYDVHLDWNGVYIAAYGSTNKLMLNLTLHGGLFVPCLMWRVEGEWRPVTLTVFLALFRKIFGRKS